MKGIPVNQKRWRIWLTVFALLMAAVGLTAATNRPAAAAATPTPVLGLWAPGGTTSPQHPDVVNDYFQWGDSGGITSFLNGVPAGETPFIELEPWDGSNDTAWCSKFTGIGTNASAAVTQETAMGNAIAAYGKPVIVTFAHEFNIGGQYPWAKGDACGTTPAQWIQAWDAARTGINAHAGGDAFWMWAPNVDPNGSNTIAKTYWPGAANVDMLGVDGYPGFCECGGTFADTFGGTFSELHSLSALPIFVSETNLAELGSGGFEAITPFIADLKADGGTGVLEFEEGSLAKMTPAQWTEADAALAAGGSTPTPTPTTPTPTPPPAGCTVTSPTGACGPFSDPGVFTSSNGADLVVQNDFSSIPQTLNAPADNNWTVTANTTGSSDQTSVKSYPATQVTYTLPNGKPDPSSDFGATLTSNFANVVPSGAGQDYEFAADDWLADPAKASWTNDLEVMIWTHTNGQVPAGSDTGKVYTDAAGTQWEVWVSGGATTVSPDSTVTFVRKVNTDSGSFERIGFYKYLQANGMLAATYGVDQLNYGLEICSTGGGAKVYGVSAYTTTPNGTAPTPTPTPTTPTPTPTTPTPTPTTPTPTPTPTPTQPSCTFTAAPHTSPPTIAAAVSGSHVQITWGGEGGETYFEVHINLPSGVLYKDVTTPAQSATFSPVPTTGTYKYAIRAGNCFGAGPWSATKTFTVTH